MDKETKDFKELYKLWMLKEFYHWKVSFYPHFQDSVLL